MRHRPGRTSSMTGQNMRATWVCTQCDYTRRAPVSIASGLVEPPRCTHGHGTLVRQQLQVQEGANA